MKTKVVSMVLGASLGFMTGASAQNAEVPELKVLANYVGKWEATFSIDGKDEEMKAEVSARWVLGKRYVQQTSILGGETDADAFSIMTLMTYDAAAGGYRKWTFTSSGNASEETGEWDAATKTLTWTGMDSKSGNTTTVSAAFQGKNEEHWSIATEDNAGALVTRITGVNRRK